MRGVELALDWSEVEWAARVGCSRRISALQNGRRPAYGAAAHGGETDAWAKDILGAMGELVVAKFLNREWEGGTRLDYDGDVGPGVHVRTTEYRTGHLLLHAPDEEAGMFYLVTGRVPVFRIVGKIVATKGKRACWWKEPPEAAAKGFWVPQRVLAEVA